MTVRDNKIQFLKDRQKSISQPVEIEIAEWFASGSSQLHLNGGLSVFQHQLIQLQLLALNSCTINKLSECLNEVFL